MTRETEEPPSTIWLIREYEGSLLENTTMIPDGSFEESEVTFTEAEYLREMNPYREFAPGGEEEKGASDDEGNYHTRATVQSNRST